MPRTLTRTMLAVANAAAADEDPRYPLRCVQVDEAGRAIATNGSVLAIVTPSEDAPADLPDIPGFSQESEAAAVMLPLTAVKRLKSPTGIPKSRNDSLKRAILGEAANGQLAVAHSDQKSPVILPYEEPEGRFPDFQRVKPAGAPESVVGLGLPVLEVICKVLREFGAVGAIRLELHGADAPFQLSAKNGEGEEVCIVAQSCRL